MFSYLYNLYNDLINYIYNIYLEKYKTTILSYNYNLPFDIDELDNEKFIQFKNDTINLNKVIFALNNIPDIVHKELFKNNFEVNKQYYSITIKLLSSEAVDIYHNIQNINDDIDDINTRYIFIRINLLQPKTFYNSMNHVNCIIIDKAKNIILIFEPQVKLRYDVDILKNLLNEFITNINHYEILLPEDIGYSYYNRLQKYDIFCQTYVVFAFILYIYNNNLKVSKLSMLFNTVITKYSTEYFLFYIYNLLESNNYELNNTTNIWNHPTSTLTNIFNIFKYNNTNINQEVNLVHFEEDNDMIIVSSNSYDK